MIFDIAYFLGHPAYVFLALAYHEFKS